VAVPAIWNELPTAVLEVNSLPVFRRRLETHLFTIAFNSNLSANCNGSQRLCISIYRMDSLWCFDNLVLTNYPVPDISGDGVLFSIDFFVCLYVCLFIYFFVSLLARLRENGRDNLKTSM